MSKNNNIYRPHRMKNNLADVENLLEKYTIGTNFCFKMCRDEYLVVMEKIEDTITNEDRKSVVDLKYAKCRANKLLVIKIINVNTLNEIDQVENAFCVCSDYVSNVIYKKGLITESDSYDKNLENVCSNGIHYFNRIEPAFYYRDFPDEWTGIWKLWYDNGASYLYEEYLNKVLHGAKIKWSAKNNVEYEEIYSYGKLLSRKQWNVHGQKYGKWIELYPNKNIKSTGTYFNDMKNGTWCEYRENGSLYSKCIYTNNLEHGECFLHYPEGMTILTYIMGEIVDMQHSAQIA